jgi:hypothetical protein
VGRAPIAVLQAAALPLLVLEIAACATGPGEAARPGRPGTIRILAAGEAPDPEAAAPPAPRAVAVRLDFEVADRFFDLVARGGASEAELEAWAGLPGNRELLRMGRKEGGLTRAALAAAARSALLGEASDAPGVLGKIDIGPWDLPRRMVRAIRERQQDLLERVGRAVAAGLPSGPEIPPLTIYFHLGGAWDGRTWGASYINLTFFQARGIDSLPALDALLVHELFHQAQAALLAGVEDYSSPQSLLFTALLRIQQEGIARHLEHVYLRRNVPEAALDRTNFQKYQDGLRHAAEHAGLLGEIEAAAARGDLPRARALVDQGFTAGGPLYAVGHSMARMIDRRLGSAALASTVGRGPIIFFRTYLEAARGGGQPSILPAVVAARLDGLQRGYGGAWIAAARGRREGLRLLRLGRPSEAVPPLRRSVRIDGTDAVSAYNLACAYALSGREGAAMRWLERAIERGFRNHKLLATDPDLDALRGRPDFARLSGRVPAATGGGGKREPPPDEPAGDPEELEPFDR